MDNLIAAGKARPMVVVSSNSNVRSRNGGFGGGYSWEGMQTFRKELLENIIPFVEKNYKVRKDPKGRAMCGLSMGGGQSFYIGLRDPDVFANVGVFSTGMFGGIRGASNFDLEKEVPGILSDTHTFNKQFDVFFMTCGEQDPRIEYTRSIVKTMHDKSVEVRFKSYPGDLTNGKCGASHSTTSHNTCSSNSNRKGQGLFRQNINVRELLRQRNYLTFFHCCSFFEQAGCNNRSFCTPNTHLK